VAAEECATDGLERLASVLIRRLSLARLAGHRQTVAVFDVRAASHDAIAVVREPPQRRELVGGHRLGAMPRCRAHREHHAHGRRATVRSLAVHLCRQTVDTSICFEILFRHARVGPQYDWILKTLV